ncbi:MAG: hypothetical protein E6L03_01020 [Thaumarchaeota archaeon]|nr:MAG: hypothetical protein E6L03_01020 [Nitrososphaerota archaeon]
MKNKEYRAIERNVFVKETHLVLIMRVSLNNTDWFRRRWLDFRNGHTIYLVFAMTFANFITIQYKLLIDKIPYFSGIFDSILIFALLFILIYVPLSIFLGYWHRKTQWKVEQDALFRENKVGAIMWMYVIDLIEGNVSEEDKKIMKEALMRITKGETRLYGAGKISDTEGK